MTTANLPAAPLSEAELAQIEKRAEAAKDKYGAYFVEGAVDSAMDVPRLVAEVRRLREALAWYAKRRHYEYDVETGSPVWIDNGERARAALAEEPST